jgi:hypothetical protein
MKTYYGEIKLSLKIKQRYNEQRWKSQTDMKLLQEFSDTFKHRINTRKNCNGDIADNTENIKKPVEMRM